MISFYKPLYQRRRDPQSGFWYITRLNWQQNTGTMLSRIAFEPTMRADQGKFKGPNSMQLLIRKGMYLIDPCQGLQG